MTDISYGKDMAETFGKQPRLRSITTFVRHEHKRVLVMTIIAVLLGAAGAGWYAVEYYRSELQRAQQSVQTGTREDTEADRIIKEVSSMVMTPSGETPTVANVADVDKLKSQAFFTSAQNGDVVLIYASAKRAILYRPSEKKVIEATSVTFDAITSPTPTPKRR